MQCVLHWVEGVGERVVEGGAAEVGGGGVVSFTCWKRCAGCVGTRWMLCMPHW